MVEGVALHPALALDARRRQFWRETDTFLGFEDADPRWYTDHFSHWTLEASKSLRTTAFAREGQWAALFQPGNNEGGLLMRPQPGAFFHEASRPADFTIEFWLYPAVLGDGEHVFYWHAGSPRDIRDSGRGDGRFGRGGQSLRCQVLRNRIEWELSGFFVSPDGKLLPDLRLGTRSTMLPERWTHHLLRFDSHRGLLEYLVDGVVQAITHTTDDGREGGSVYLPHPGPGGELVLGGRYAGVLDNFAIHARYNEHPDLDVYPPMGGRMESRWFDLGAAGARLDRIDLAVRTPGMSAYRLFARSSNNPRGEGLARAPWQSLEAGTPQGERFVGRWVQVAMELYPGDRDEQSPIVEEVRLTVIPDEAPAPPPRIIARADDGAVELEWAPSPDPDTVGYVVYYGTERGVYFGRSGTGQDSPLDAGAERRIRIEGLENGRLYWFAVAAWDNPHERNIGTYSVEVPVRPLRMD